MTHHSVWSTVQPSVPHKHTHHTHGMCYSTSRVQKVSPSTGQFSMCKVGGLTEPHNQQCVCCVSVGRLLIFFRTRVYVLGC